MTIRNDFRLVNRSLHRASRRPDEGALAAGIIAEVSATEAALSAIRSSRERLDSFHGVSLDFAPRLRALCWEMDAASAANESA